MMNVGNEGSCIYFVKRVLCLANVMKASVVILFFMALIVGIEFCDDIMWMVVKAISMIVVSFGGLLYSFSSYRTRRSLLLRDHVMVMNGKLCAVVLQWGMTIP